MQTLSGPKYPLEKEDKRKLNIRGTKEWRDNLYNEHVNPDGTHNMNLNNLNTFEIYADLKFDVTLLKDKFTPHLKEVAARIAKGRHVFTNPRDLEFFTNPKVLELELEKEFKDVANPVRKDLNTPVMVYMGFYTEIVFKEVVIHLINNYLTAKEGGFILKDTLMEMRRLVKVFLNKLTGGASFLIPTMEVWDDMENILLTLRSNYIKENLRNRVKQMVYVYLEDLKTVEVVIEANTGKFSKKDWMTVELVVMENAVFKTMKKSEKVRIATIVKQLEENPKTYVFIKMNSFMRDLFKVVNKDCFRYSPLFSLEDGAAVYVYPEFKKLFVAEAGKYLGDFLDEKKVANRALQKAAFVKKYWEEFVKYLHRSSDNTRKSLAAMKNLKLAEQKKLIDRHIKGFLVHIKDRASLTSPIEKFFKKRGRPKLIKKELAKVFSDDNVLRVTALTSLSTEGKKRRYYYNDFEK